MLNGGGIGMKNDGGWGENGNALLLVVVVVLVVGALVPLAAAGT